MVTRDADLRPSAPRAAILRSPVAPDASLRSGAPRDAAVYVLEGIAGTPVIPDGALRLLATSGVAGTGVDVDTWETTTTSGITLTAQGSSRPHVAGTRVRMANPGVNYFTAGDTSTFESITSTGDFAFGWRGSLDSFDGAVYGIDCVLFATKGNARGAFFGRASADDRLIFSAWDSSNGSLWRIDDYTFNTYVPGTIFDVVVIGDGSNVRMYIDGVQVGLTVAVATQAGAHQYTAHFGKSTNSSVYHEGTVEGVFYDGAGGWTSSDVETIRGFVTASASIVTPEDVGSLVEYLDARVAAHDYGDGDLVPTWASPLAGGVSATQGSTAAQPRWRATGVGTGPGVDFDGSDDRLDWLISLGQTTWTLQILVSLDDLGAAYRLIDISVGRILIEIASGTGAISVFDGSSFRATGVSLTTADTLLTLRCRGGDSQFDVWLDGTESASDIAYTPRNVGGTIRVASDASGAVRYVDGKIGFLALYDAALTDTEIGDIYTWATAQWGL